MIMETAYISVIPGREDEFLEALEHGKRVVEQAHGFLTIHVHRGVERPSTFLLAVGWETLEDHTVSFREGPLFPQWRSFISPFFAQAPEVEHWHLYE